MEFTTIYFDPKFDLSSLEFYTLEKLFGVELGQGFNYINVYTIDRSVVDSIADEIGRDNITEISYT